MRRVGICVSLLALLVIGCGQPKPLLAGGKPVSHWLEALRSPDPKVRKTAVTRLGNVGKADPAALPGVIGALKDSDAAVRCEAILAVSQNGSAADEAVPTLAAMQRDDRNARVRTYAAQALEKLRGK